MAKPLFTDELWEIIKPLLPPEKPRPKGGRPRVPDRLARQAYCSWREREHHRNFSLLNLAVEVV